MGNVFLPILPVWDLTLKDLEWNWKVLGYMHTLFYGVFPDSSLEFVVVQPLKRCLALCNPMDCSMPGFPVLYYLLEFAQTHIHWVSDAIQPSHPLPSPSPPAFNLSQHQGLFQWVRSSHQVAKILELQHQSFQWIFRVDFL